MTCWIWSIIAAVQQGAAALCQTPVSQQRYGTISAFKPSRVSALIVPMFDIWATGKHKPVSRFQLSEV